MPSLRFEIVTICLEPPVIRAAACSARRAIRGFQPVTVTWECYESLRQCPFPATTIVICSRAMSDTHLGPPTPQFDTAEYANVPGTTRCEFCKQTLAGTYYRINGHLACGSCADQARNRVPSDSHAAFVRALTFGIPAALLGLALYAAFEIMTGWIIGYLSLGVGYLVGKAMMKGSGGLGGRRYQIAAVILTYAAVSMAAIPVVLNQISKQKQVRAASAQSSSPDGQSAQSADRPSRPTMGMGKALAFLAFMGLASPFLDLQDPIHGLIGLVILFVGIQIAWKLTAGPPVPEITGPY